MGGCGPVEWAWSVGWPSGVGVVWAWFVMSGCGLLGHLACGLSQAMERKVVMACGRAQDDGWVNVDLWVGLPSGGTGLLTISGHAHAMQQHQVLVGHLAHETRSFQERLHAVLVLRVHHLQQHLHAPGVPLHHFMPVAPIDLGEGAVTQVLMPLQALRGNLLEGHLAELALSLGVAGGR